MFIEEEYTCVAIERPVTPLLGCPSLHSASKAHPTFKVYKQ